MAGLADALVEPGRQEAVVKSIVPVAVCQVREERIENADPHPTEHTAKADNKDDQIGDQRPWVMDLLMHLRELDEQHQQDQHQHRRADRQHHELFCREIVRRDRKPVPQFRHIVRRQRCHALREDYAVHDAKAGPDGRQYNIEEHLAPEEHRQRDRREHDQHVDQEDQRVHHKERYAAVDRLPGQCFGQEHDQECRCERDPEEVVHSSVEESPGRRPRFSERMDAPRPFADRPARFSVPAARLCAAGSFQRTKTLAALRCRGCRHFLRRVIADVVCLCDGFGSCLVVFCGRRVDLVSGHRHFSVLILLH